MIVFQIRNVLGDTSQILITMFIVYNLPSFHLAYILIYYCLAPTLFRVVASTHSLYLIITGTCQGTPDSCAYFTTANSRTFPCAHFTTANSRTFPCAHFTTANSRTFPCAYFATAYARTVRLRR